MILNCLLNPLRFNADVPLRGGSTAVLKEPLHQCYVKAVGVVDFRCVPLAETVDADIRISMISRNCSKALSFSILTTFTLYCVFLRAFLLTFFFILITSFLSFVRCCVPLSLCLHSIILFRGSVVLR